MTFLLHLFVIKIKNLKVISIIVVYYKSYFKLSVFLHMKGIILLTKKVANVRRSVIVIEQYMHKSQEAEKYLIPLQDDPNGLERNNMCHM